MKTTLTKLHFSETGAKARVVGLSGAIAWLLLAAGCSLAPNYQKPEAHTPDAYKESFSEQASSLPKDQAGNWKVAAPSEQLARGQWWTVFGDEQLNQLEDQAQKANQNLQAAVARLKESRAVQQTVNAAKMPTLDAGFGPTREQDSPASQGLSHDDNVPAKTLWRAQASSSYDVDLFGRVSDSANAASADAEQSEALLRSVLLAVQADVAQNWFELRQLDAEVVVYQRAVKLREEAMKFSQSRFDAGQTAELDLVRAKSELATAKSDAMTVERQRAITEHRLAVLLGQAPSQFSLASTPLTPVQVVIPPGLPSSLLERRPDIAAAERSMAASNSRIGVAKAAFFPSLTLTGSAGFESSSLSNLFNWSSKAFLLGPLTGTMLNIPIFDGGRRKGNLANAQAVYEEDVARYRQQVLVAFQEVEDNLSSLRILQAQTQTQKDAVNASTQAADISRHQYDEGAAPYLDVIDAERSALQAQREAVQLTAIQAVSTVNLIRALGGGWGPISPSVPGITTAKLTENQATIKRWN